jgi:hypothetical protein
MRETVGIAAVPVPPELLEPHAARLIVAAAVAATAVAARIRLRNTAFLL